MVFELYSYTTDISSDQQIPNPADLFVRFLFRNGTDGGSSLDPYPLFGRTSTSDMSWYDFLEAMDDFSIDDVSEWCEVCETMNLFCAALSSNMNYNPATGSISTGSSGTSKSAISPIVGGVIGAAVTLAIAILAFAVLGFCGFRVRKNSRGENQNAGVESGKGGGISSVFPTMGGKFGGFKGAEKLASDTDLRLKGGAGATVVRHERVGSWELGDKKNQHASLDGAARGEDYGRKSDDLDRGVNPFGDPVRPVDQV